MQNFITTPTIKSSGAMFLNERVLIPFLPAASLLSSPRHKKIITDIFQLINIQTEQQDLLYKQLIYNFAQFIQLIPIHNETRLGSMLDKGLLRALLALQLQKQETATNDDNSNVDPLIEYVLFSASLLFDIGFISFNRTIIISQEDGTFIKEWAPHKGEMQPSDGSHYRIRHGGNQSSWLSHNLTPLLARQLMPPVGFNWIAEDSDALNTWLSLLLNHKDKESNELKSNLEHANKKAHKELESFQISLPKDICTIEPKATVLGEEFLEWVSTGLKNKTLEINKYNADIHAIENGLFLEIPSIIEKFCANSPLNPSSELVIKQLKKIGFLATNRITKYTYCNQPPTSLFIQPPKPQPTKQINKYDTREGIEVLSTYFLSIRYKLKLTAEKNFVQDEIKKENKKKAYLIKRKKQKRFRILLKEAEEALQVQAKLNLGIKN